MNQYATYTPAQFVADAFFRLSHRQPTPEHTAFWEAFLAEYPGQRAAYEEARLLMQELDRAEQTYRQHSLPDHQRRALWARIDGSVPAEGRPGGRVVRLPGRRWSLYAAALTGLLLVALAGWWWRQAAVPSVYETAYGETRRVNLPDGTQVWLNANSTLTLEGTWEAGQDRRVSLRGEAFFHVTHQPHHERFLVRGGGVTVEVLGTQFNVSTRRARTRVALKEGSVRLAAEGRTLLMRPGETVEWSPQRAQLARTPEPAARAAAWTGQRLVFDQTPLSEVAQTIEEQFGTRVEIRNPALREKRLTGEISLVNEALLLEALETIYNVRARRDGATLVFE
jgi:transmembrane sensor